MASIQRHAFGGAADLPLVLDLIRAVPAACRHVIDFPWRLTAPDIIASRDAVYWRDAGGRVVGLAAWQQPWATLDFYIRPGPDAVAVERDVFAWAGGRFRERDAERGHRLPYSVEFRDDDQDRRALAGAHGFTRDARASHVRLQCQLDAPPPVAPIPEGFVIRPLAGAAEAAAYTAAHRAAFASAAMTERWRERTVGASLYDPDLDLHRIRDRGASVVVAETNLERTAARAAYDAAGFRQSHTIWRVQAWAADVWLPAGLDASAGAARTRVNRRPPSLPCTS